MYQQGSRYGNKQKQPAALESDAEIKNAALGLLARREHSMAELITKLKTRCEDEHQLENVLFALQEDGYISDQRFTESFLRQRIYQGFGPMKIRFDMKQKGISSEMLEIAILEQEVDWFEMAKEVYQRKFQPQDGFDPKGYAKRMRYMMQRGFDTEQARYAIDAKEE